MNFQKDVIATFDLKAEQELRFEVDWTEKVQLKMIRGRAEIFGNEIALEAPYTFTGGSKLAVFTWHGCSIEIRGNIKVAYVSSETPMVTYINIHLILEELRQSALDNGKIGPRVMVVGPPDSGKTSLCKILLNYGLKREWKPIFVDLDSSGGTLIAPTTIGAVAIDRPDVEESFGFSLVTSPPLLYYYGENLPGKNPILFNQIVSTLAEVVLKRLETDSDLTASGLIIDTHSWSEALGYDTYFHAVEAFQVDTILVVGSERLHSDFVNKFKDYPRKVNVVKVAKSGGVVTRETLFRKQMQMKKVKEYFYGTSSHELSPYTTSIPFSEIAVRRIGEASAAPSSALPLGMEKRAHELQILKVEGAALLHSILFLSTANLQHNATEKDEQELTSHNIAGLVYVSEVNDDKKRLHLLCPNPGKLPKRYLWMGTLRWAEVS